MNILFIAHRIPYPPNKGDKIRSFNEIKFLSQGHDIYLGTILDQPSDEQYVLGLKEYCKEVHAVYFNKRVALLKNILKGKPFSVCSFYHTPLQKYIDKVLAENNIDVVICFCSSVAEYVFKTPAFLKKEQNGIKFILDYVDLDSDKWGQYATYSRFPLSWVYAFERRRLLQYEIKINQLFHHSFFVSKREVDMFKGRYPDAKNLAYISNGVDFEYFSPKKRSVKNDKPILIFTGVMDYFANEDGVAWFCNHVFEKIKEKIPNTQFYIVGNNPTEAVKNLSKIEGVHVTGYVDDIREFYWMADICVIPLRIARGLQNKVLEAMATGNAIVATSNASDGVIVHEDMDIIIADDEDHFARAVVALLEDEAKRIALGEKAKENVYRHYSWDANLAKLGALIS